MIRRCDISNKNKNKFVHLHVHSHYSLLDGMGRIPDYLDKAKELGMEALAITDHGTMYGVIEFYKEAKKRDIKPIIGCECYIAPRKLTDKAAKIDIKPFHVVLLAKNNKGYKNLLKLTSIAHLEGYYYKPRIDKDVLREHSEGLIALSACVHGEVANAILNSTYDNAKKIAQEYVDIFGKDHFYLELQDHPDFPEQKTANDGLIKIAKELDIPLVVTNDIHYANKEDAEAQDILICLQTGKLVTDEDRMKMTSDNSMRDPKELAKAFKDVPEALENTVKIADMCNLELELGGIIIPDFPVPKGETLRSYLEKKLNEGLKKRYGTLPKEYRDRADYELSVIERMGYEGYFLIVADYVNWAKDHGIIVGPGRGSGAGSIIAYALKIVDIDPMKYNLLFERFLNPDRISMPDFDIDFADDRRGEVIEYVTEKYGKDHVAQIITFGTMKARNAIRDTGRVLGFPYAEVDRIAKMVPEVLGIKLKDAINESQELRGEYTSDSKIRHLLDLAMKLEGVARHSSTHAAGVVISKEPLVEYAPLQKAVKGDISWQTQYEMHAIEDIGLLKMDFLGLSNLTIIKNTLRIIRKVYGEEIDIYTIPMDDKKTFNLLSKAETTGVFQLESAGMKRYIKDLKPTVFEDIVAMVALYRPGPMQFIDEFIACKHGKKNIKYLHPKMENALKNTYGVIVYQEQVMQMTKDMAGFTGGQADTLRKAMGKKIKELMVKVGKEFVQGCEKNGVDRKIAETLYQQMQDFAQYAFNKSHAACYALIAYWTAYLKAHYPNAFMAALLTSDYGNIDRITIEIAECQRMKIEVLPPDVNESFAEFAVVKETGKIRFGLSAIKNVGMGVIEAIQEARKEGGKFKSIEDFAKRVNSGELNKKVLESLIKCGAFDSILPDRAKLLTNMERILSFAGQSQGHHANGQIDLFGANGVELPPLKLEKPLVEVSNRERLNWEKELLGIYISEHPADEFQETFLRNGAKPISDINEELSGLTAQIGGVVTGIQKITTRSKENMLFVTFEDSTGQTELLIFPKLLKDNGELWQIGKILFVTGKVSTKDNQIKIICNRAVELDREAAKGGKVKIIDPLITQSVQVDKDGVVNIYIPRGTSATALNDIKYKLVSNKGEVPVVVYVPNGKEGPKKVRLPFGIKFNQKMQEAITSRLAEN
jgi:DNA polymerase-3 subunit alpha